MPGTPSDAYSLYMSDARPRPKWFDDSDVAECGFGTGGVSGLAHTAARLALIVGHGRRIALPIGGLEIHFPDSQGSDSHATTGRGEADKVQTERVQTNRI